MNTNKSIFILIVKQRNGLSYLTSIIFFMFILEPS